jgi:RecA-family ATPase
MLDQKIKKYKIEITETLQRVEEVHCKDFEEALEKIFNLYRKEEIVLDWNDFVGVEFNNFHLPRVIFKITKEEILGHFKELKISGEIDKNKKITDMEMKKVLDFVECDELLAKDIRKSIRNSILEIVI